MISVDGAKLDPVVQTIVVQDDEDPVGIARGEWWVGAVFADQSYFAIALNVN